MGQIKDITKYPIKASPAAGDTVIGSDNAAGGATVQFDVTNFGAGGSVDDDNLIKLIDFGKVLIGDFGENEFTGVASKVNSLDSISATFTDIVVIKGIVYDSTGSFIATYLVNNYGKGNYGTGGITLVDTDLIRIEKEFITQFPDTSTDVNAVVYDLGEIGSTTVSDAVNLLDPSVVIASGENWYFEYTNGGTRYLYGFDGAVGTYGLNDTLTVDTDFFLVYDGTIPTSITKTSDLVNDGSDATSTYVETDELATVAFTGSYSDLTGAPSSASGLEAVDEGNGDGYRIIGFDPLNYGNIGLGSVDFGQNTAPSATFGTKGLYGLNFGQDNTQATGQYYNFTSGVNNITGNSYGWAHGQGNQATEFMSYAWGWENTVPDPYSMTFGVFNNVQDFYSGAVGLGLDVQSPHSFFVGTGNTIYANTTINQADTRLFGVGNGSVLAGTPNTVDVRSDAFLVYWDGRVVAPSLSVADIDGESTGFVLTTREWIEAQNFTSIVASETAAAQRLFVGTGAGATNSGTATVAIGHSSMNASGVASQDTALGVESLYNLVTGNDNVAIGYTAGKFLNSVAALTDATQSVFIGSDTRSLADSQTNEIVIGYGGRGRGSNTMVLGNSSLTEVYTEAVYRSPNHIEIENNSQRWIQITNVGFTEGTYIDNTGFVNTVNGNNYIDIDATNRFIVLGVSGNSLILTNTAPTGGAKTQTFQDRTGTVALNKDVADDVTTTYNFVLTDANNIVTLNNASPVSAVIPANASVAYPIGTEIVIINKGVGTVTVSVTSDTINTELAGLTIPQYGKRTVIKIASTEWILGN